MRLRLAKQAFARDPYLTLAFAGLAVATVVPFWAGRYLPLLDLPNHLSAIAVWHYYNDPRFDFAQYYRLNLAPLPYWAYYSLVHLGAYVLGIERANKVFLSLYALAFPTGCWLFAKQFGRSPWLALFAFPLAWNYNLANGFISYVSGVALVPFALVLVGRHCRRPSWQRAALTFGAGTLLYFFHILPYAYFLVCGCLVAFAETRPKRLKELAVRVLPVAAGALVGMYVYFRSAHLHLRRIPGAHWQAVQRPLITTLANLPSQLLDVLSSSRDEWVLVALAASWLAIALTCSSQRRTSWAPEICWSVAAGCWLLLPSSLVQPFYCYNVNGRFATVVGLFGILLVCGAVQGRQRWLFAPVIAAGLFYAGALTRMVVTFNHHVQGFDELVAMIPPHRRVLTLSLPPLGDPEVNTNCFNEWGSYVQIQHGGYNFYNFSIGFPLAYKVQLPAPPWNHQQSFDWSRQAASYDYFLAHNDDESQYHLFRSATASGAVELVASQGSWKLWHRLR